VQKLERGNAGDGDAKPFYILWVPAGADRVAALDELRASGKITADVPVYCAEWKLPNGRWRDRLLGPRPRSRLTNQRHISDEEVAVLEKAICRDFRSSGFSSNSSASDDVRGQQLNKMTTRELIGVILKSPIDMLVSGSAIHKRSAPPTKCPLFGSQDGV
jgi:hypothetical protein